MFRNVFAGSKYNAGGGIESMRGMVEPARSTPPETGDPQHLDAGRHTLRGAAETARFLAP